MKHFAPTFRLRGPFTCGGIDYMIEGPGGPYSLAEDTEGLFDLYRGSECIREHVFPSPEDAVDWLEEGHDALPVAPITATVRDLTAPEFVKENA